MLAFTGSLTSRKVSDKPLKNFQTLTCYSYLLAAEKFWFAKLIQVVSPKSKQKKSYKNTNKRNKRESEDWLRVCKNQCLSAFSK